MQLRAKYWVNLNVHDYTIIFWVTPPIYSKFDFKKGCFTHI